MSKHQRNAAGAPGAPAAPAEGEAPARPRALFDASYVCSVDGKRVTFAPGDPVPDHIDPAELPPGAWRLAPEEG